MPEAPCLARRRTSQRATPAPFTASRVMRKGQRLAGYPAPKAPLLGRRPQSNETGVLPLQFNAQRPLLQSGAVGCARDERDRREREQPVRQ